MANEVATMTEQQLAAVEAAKSMMGGLRRVQRTAPRASGGDFMRFGKDGLWSFGRENKSVDTDVDYALLNILSLKEGYVCWEDNDGDNAKNKKLGEEMAPVNQPIALDDLPDHGFPWNRQQSIQIKFLEGTYKGTQTVYAPSSQGGLEALGAVVDLVLERMAAETPFFFPIVALDKTHYMHPKWGKTYKPVIDIVGWADVDGNEDGAFEAPPKKEPEPAPKPAAKPARRVAAAPKPEPTPEPTPEPEREEVLEPVEAATNDAQPVRRRR